MRHLHALILFTVALCNLVHAVYPWPPFFRPRPGKKRPHCDCYIVSGPDRGYFQHYGFYDFRRPWRGTSPRGPDDKDAGRFYADDAATVRAPRSHPSLADTSFVRDWEVQEWERQASPLYPVDTVTSFENVYLSNDGPPWSSSHLVLRTTRFPNYTSAAEVVSRARNIFHCSIRVRLRLYSPLCARPKHLVVRSTDDLSNVSARASAGAAYFPPLHLPPASGAVAAIFTYFSHRSESDIEIRTSDPPTTVHYCNQPDWDPATDLEIPGSHDIVTLPRPWTSWSTHRLDWLPTISRWYQDGVLQSEKTYGVPTDPSLLALNLWSNGGVWSGDMDVGSSVLMGIEWIEVAYNTTSARPIPQDVEEGGREWLNDSTNYPPRLRPPPLGQAVVSDVEEQPEHQCKNVCRIDRVRRVGVPELVRL
ncbi:hypothetical protein VTO42DRAFT_8550 [Malbranchea cinnamomea]